MARFCLFVANYNGGMCRGTLYTPVCYVFVGCFGFVGLLCFVFCVCFVWLVFCVCCGWWLWCFVTCVEGLEGLEACVCKGFGVWAWIPLGTSQALRLLWPCNRFVLCVTPLCAHFLFALSQGSVTLLTGDSPMVSRALLTSVVVVGQGSTIPFFVCCLVLGYLGYVFLARRFCMFFEDFDEVFDVDDDEVLECGLENPDICESCQ